MAEISHVFDPEGDIILTLRNPNAPFAVWVDGPGWSFYRDIASKSLKIRPDRRYLESMKEFTILDPAGKEKRMATPAGEATSTSTKGSTPQQIEKTSVSAKDTEIKETRMQVSSRHLTLSSPYFKSMLQGPWQEGSTRCVDADDW